MSGSDQFVPAGAPSVSTEVEEMHGVFPSDAALQDAIGRLTQAGFDRADLSLPDAEPPTAADTPGQGAANPNTDDDRRQTRTLGTSIAAASGAMTAAGVVIATGGAALPAVAAAVAGGVGAGALPSLAHTASNAAEADERQEAARDGRLVLAAALRDPAKADAAERAMTAAGATRVVHVRRVTKAA